MNKNRLIKKEGRSKTSYKSDPYLKIQLESCEIFYNKGTADQGGRDIRDTE